VTAGRPGSFDRVRSEAEDVSVALSQLFTLGCVNLIAGPISRRQFNQ
jgi:hypothetical protein